MASKINHTRTDGAMYAVAWVLAEPEGAGLYPDLYYDVEYEPEGWAEYAIMQWGVTPPEGEHWPKGYKPFFWPSTKRLYTTRKAAEARRDLIKHWGGDAVVVVAEVEWHLLEDMDAKWKRDRLEAQREAIDAALAELDAALEGEADGECNPQE